MNVFIYAVLIVGIIIGIADLLVEWFRKMK